MSPSMIEKVPPSVSSANSCSISSEDEGEDVCGLYNFGSSSVGRSQGRGQGGPEGVPPLLARLVISGPERWPLGQDHNTPTLDTFALAPRPLLKKQVTMQSMRTYSNFKQRLASFKEWPKAMPQKPKTLAEAGFYYTGEKKTLNLHFI